MNITSIKEYKKDRVFKENNKRLIREVYEEIPELIEALVEIKTFGVNAIYMSKTERRVVHYIQKLNNGYRVY